MFTSIVLAAAGAVTKFRLHINAEKPDEHGSGTNSFKSTTPVL